MNLSVSSLSTACNFVCTVPVTSTVLIPTQMWPEISVSRVLEEYITLKYILEFYTVQFGFYSVKSLHIVCEVSTVCIVVVSTWKWPENKYPESQDA